jgi:uncharacterized protein (TIGR02118 family)
MFKLVILAKRKPGMSMEAFREHYETRHAVLVQKITPGIKGYRRSYLTPFQDALSGQHGSAFDVVTETWFDSEADFRRTFDALSNEPEKTAAIAADEENLFDRSSIRWFTAVEAGTAPK